MVSSSLPTIEEEKNENPIIELMRERAVIRTLQIRKYENFASPKSNL